MDDGDGVVPEGEVCGRRAPSNLPVVVVLSHHQRQRGVLRLPLLRDGILRHGRRRHCPPQRDRRLRGGPMVRPDDSGAWLVDGGAEACAEVGFDHLVK